jgi:hypothetical protein
MLLAAERYGHGHRLAGDFLVATHVCSCQDRLLSWSCNTCGDSVNGHPLGDHCEVLHGAARVG